jgi:hypothetical protein
MLSGGAVLGNRLQQAAPWSRQFPLSAIVLLKRQRLCPIVRITFVHTTRAVHSIDLSQRARPLAARIASLVANIEFAAASATHDSAFTIGRAQASCGTDGARFVAIADEV